MKRMILSIFTLAVFFVLAACGVSQEAPTPPENTTPEDASPSATAETAVTLTVDGQTFSAALLDNELPTDLYQPGQIYEGDLMLYGNNCLVLFYESFSSGYSYTRLGSADDPAGLAEALGTGSVEVAFSVRDDG